MEKQESTNRKGITEKKKCYLGTCGAANLIGYETLRKVRQVRRIEIKQAWKIKVGKKPSNRRKSQKSLKQKTHSEK